MFGGFDVGSFGQTWGRSGDGADGASGSTAPALVVGTAVDKGPVYLVYSL